MGELSLEALKASACETTDKNELRKIIHVIYLRGCADGMQRTVAALRDDLDITVELSALLRPQA